MHKQSNHTIANIALIFSQDLNSIEIWMKQSTKISDVNVKFSVVMYIKRTMQLLDKSQNANYLTS